MASLITFFTHKFFKILFALYVFLFMLIWLISSPVIKHYLPPILAEHHLALSDDASIRFNPFLMRVTLSDISLSSTREPQQAPVFTLDELQLQVALWQLAFDKIVLSKFTLSDGSINITQYDDRIVIAGIEIPNSKEAQAANSSDSKTTTDAIANNEDASQTLAPVNDEVNQASSTNAFPYQLVLPNFLLSEFAIHINKKTQQDKNKTHHIKIEQLAINQLLATESDQQANLALTALIDQTNLALTADTVLSSGKGNINSSLRLSNYPLANLAQHVEELADLKGTLTFTSQQTVTLAGPTTNARVHKAQLDIKDLLVALPKQQVTLGDFNYNTTNFAIDLQEEEITHLEGNTSIHLTDFSVNDVETQDTIASFVQLNLDDIAFILDDAPSIDIESIVLNNFLFSKKSKLADEVAQEAMTQINKLAEQDGVDISAEALVKLPPVMELKQLSINNIHIHPNSIDINSIIFDTLTGDIIVKKNKELANLVNLGEKPAEETEPLTEQTETANTENTPSNAEEEVSSTPDTTKNDESFMFSLNELRFVNDHAFTFTDFSVDPIYQRTLYIDTLDLGALSNRADKKEAQTPFTFIGRSNKYANFNLKGYLQPFTDTQSYHIEGDLKEFSLPAISTYLKPSTGLEVKTGQLNTGLNVTLTGEELDGNVVVLLQALETAMVDEEEAGNLISQGALPLNMAMGMLKDSDGNVELDVPISGSTSDPEFGLSSIVTLITQKAILSATQDYLMTTFVPYANIVSVAITAGEFALKLRFDDLEYKAKQIKPDQSQSAYLTEFIALMHDKEDARVTICAISTPDDIGLKPGVPVKDKASIKKLIDIGDKREHAFKDYLIEEGKLSSSRILFCKPKIDSSEGAVPRIEISA